MHGHACDRPSCRVCRHYAKAVSMPFVYRSAAVPCRAVPLLPPVPRLQTSVPSSVSSAPPSGNDRGIERKRERGRERERRERAREREREREREGRRESSSFMPLLTEGGRGTCRDRTLRQHHQPPPRPCEYTIFCPAWPHARVLSSPGNCCL